MNDLNEKKHCVVTYYQDGTAITNTPPLTYYEARDAWLKATDQGQKFVLKTHGCWVKIERCENAPPYIESKRRRRK